MTAIDAVWRENYEGLKRYVLERGHLPDKHVVENRALLNWAKYNRKKIKSGTLEADKVQRFWHFAATNRPAAASRKTPRSAAPIAKILKPRTHRPRITHSETKNHCQKMPTDLLEAE